MFDWNSYLELAKELALKEEEQCKRTAVSRAYYASFHNARTYLKNKGISYNSRETVHKYVWNAFSKLSPLERKICTKGDRLKLKRQKVDYEAEVNNLTDLTERAIKEAEDINDSLNKLVN